MALFPGRSLWANLCNVPAGQNKGAESCALQCLARCCLSASLPPAPNPPGCWGRGFKTSPFTAGQLFFPRRQRLSWQRSFLGSRRVPRASEVCASCPDLPRALPRGRQLAERKIPFLRVGIKIWESLKVRICKGHVLKYVFYPTSEVFYPGQSVGSLGLLSWEPDVLLNAVGHRTVLGGDGHSVGERRSREEQEFMDMVDCKMEPDGEI